MSWPSTGCDEVNPLIDDACRLENGLGAYLTQRLKVLTPIYGMRLVPGGAARATWRCSAVIDGAECGLILRVDSGRRLLPTDERAEFLTVAAVYRAGFPVSEPVLFEEDERWLGRRFSLVKEVQNCSSVAERIPAPYRSKMGLQLWTTLGKLARYSLDELAVDGILAPTRPESCAREQLDYWRGILAASEIHPNPIVHAGFRWLRNNPVPRAQKLSLVHGDYRTGNYLYSADGDIRAILDWEMAHIGDPLEDLTWSLDLRQNIDKPSLAGGLIPHREAVRIWQEASGLVIDPTAFRWWQVFSAVKGLTIWILAARKFQDGEDKRPILARIGWLLADRQQRILLDYISPYSEHRFYEFSP